MTLSIQLFLIQIQIYLSHFFPPVIHSNVFISVRSILCVVEDVQIENQCNVQINAEAYIKLQEILYYIKNKILHIPIYEGQHKCVNSGKLVKQDKICSYFVCNVSCPSKFLCSSLLSVVMTVYINLMQPRLNTEVISLLVLVCPPPPVSRTSIILLHVLQGNHWISTCTLSENVFLNCLISWCVFFSHTWVQEKDVGFFFTLLYFFLIRRESGPQGQDVIFYFFF